MTTTTDIVDQIRKESGIVDLSKLSPGDARKLLKLIGEQRLSEAHVRALVEVAPQFASVANEALKTVSEVAEGAKEAQKDALSAIDSAISGITTVLSVLAEKAQSDQTREKIAQYLIEAGKLYVEITKITANMNKDNNDSWIKIAGIAGALATALAGIAITVLSGRGSK